MVSTVNVGSLTSGNLAPYTGNIYAFSTDDSTAVMYTTGITLIGSGASSWMTVLQNRSATPFRKLINGN